MRNKDILRKLVIGTFLSVPAISSVISTIHLIDLFNLGNPEWLSILLAVTFELGSIASFLALSVIERIKVGPIWVIFFVLAGLQIVGNVYYTYSYTSDMLLANPKFLTNFLDLFSFLVGNDIKDIKIFLSCVIGIPIPLIALFFLKSNIDYVRPAGVPINQEDATLMEDNVQLSEDTTVISDDIDITQENNSITEDENHIKEEDDENTDEQFEEIEESSEINESIEEGELEENAYFDASDFTEDFINEPPNVPRRRRTRVIGNTSIKY